MIKIEPIDKLRLYLNGLPVPVQNEFAKRCGTTANYMRKAISRGQKIGARIAVNIEKESLGQVRVEDVRPDVDWAYIRRRTSAKVAAEAIARMV